MKKLISLLAALAVVSTASVAFAAETDYGTITVPDNLTKLEATDGSYTVNVSTSDQGTILAVQGTSIKVGSIQYINQATASNGTASFTFKLNDDRLDKASSADSKVYVLTNGGVVGYIETAQSTAPATFTISGTVSGYAGSTLPTVVVSDGTNSYTATVDSEGKFSVDVPVLESGSYTLTATKGGHLKYTKANITNEATVNPTLKAGDMNADNIANVSDMALIVDNYNAKNGSDGYTASYDVNEDNILNVSDMALVVDNYNAKAISE